MRKWLAGAVGQEVVAVGGRAGEGGASGGTHHVGRRRLAVELPQRPRRARRGRHGRVLARRDLRPRAEQVPKARHPHALDPGLHAAPDPRSPFETAHTNSKAQAQAELARLVTSRV